MYIQCMYDGKTGSEKRKEGGKVIKGNGNGSWSNDWINKLEKLLKTKSIKGCKKGT